MSTTHHRGAPGASTSPLVIGLGALLVVQIVAALILGLGGPGMTPAQSQGPLVALERDRIHRVRIETQEGEPLLLEKRDEAWLLPALGDFPASDRKIGELLDKLSGISTRLPVATSESAAARFRVAEDGYERRLTLETEDGAVATLYLGDSPGFRRLFVRAAGEPEIYEAELALFDTAAEPDDWTDKRYLHLKADDIQRLELPDAVLERRDGTWVLTDPREGETLDAEAAEDAVRQVARLDFAGVLRAEDHPADAGQEPDLTIGVTLKSGEEKSYRLYGAGEDGTRLLDVSDEPYGFELTGYTAEALVSLGRSALLTATEPAPAEEPGEPADAEAAVEGGVGAGSAIVPHESGQPTEQ